MKNKTICIILSVLTIAILLCGCNKKETVKTANMLCEIGTESYMYKVTYDEDYKVLETSDIKWFNENIDNQKHQDDALEFIAYVESIIREHDGTVKHFPTETETK